MQLVHFSNACIPLVSSAAYFNLSFTCAGPDHRILPAAHRSLYRVPRQCGCKPNKNRQHGLNQNLSLSTVNPEDVLISFDTPLIMNRPRGIYPFKREPSLFPLPRTRSIMRISIIDHVLGQEIKLLDTDTTMVPTPACEPSARPRKPASQCADTDNSHCYASVVEG